MSIEETYVFYIPKKSLPLIKEPSDIISIRDYRTEPADIDPKHRVLHLMFSPSPSGAQMQVSDVAKVLEFIKNNDGRNIYVQCGEGRCRSHTLAMMIDIRLAPLIDRDIYLTVDSELSANNTFMDEGVLSAVKAYVKQRNE